MRGLNHLCAMAIKAFPEDQKEFSLPDLSAFNILYELCEQEKILDEMMQQHKLLAYVFGEIKQSKVRNATDREDCYGCPNLKHVYGDHITCALIPELFTKDDNGTVAQDFRENYEWLYRTHCPMGWINKVVI